MAKKKSTRRCESGDRKCRKETSPCTKPMDGSPGKTIAELKSEPVHMAEHAIGPNPGPMGWEDHQDWVHDQLQRMPNPILSDTPYFAEMRCVVRGHEDVMPWTWEQKALGRILRPHYQARGTCVSQAWSRAVQFTALSDMLFGGQGEEWVARVHPGSIYGASRVEIGGGRIRGDGSVGAWAARAVVKMGVLYRLKYETAKKVWDLTADQDELYSIDWGTPGRGVPDELEPAMREHPISDASMITTPEEYEAIAYDHKVAPVCSGVGYTTVRDKYGCCYPSGTWSHCMLHAGLLLIKHPQFPSGRKVVPQLQSWGPDNPSGNDRVTLQTGEEITLPPGWFLVPIEASATQWRAKDTFVPAGIRGWVPQLTVPSNASVGAK